MSLFVARQVGGRRVTSPLTQMNQMAALLHPSARLPRRHRYALIVAVCLFASPTMAARAPVDEAAGSGQAAPGGPVAFIANSGSNTVSVVDLAANLVTATIPVCAQPGPVSLAPDENHVYVFCYNGAIAAIDTRTNAVVTRSLGLRYINGMEVHPGGRHIYVTGGLNALVWVIDAATLGIVTSFSVPNSPAGSLDNHAGLTFNASGSRLYVTQCGYACGQSTLSAVDTGTHAVVAHIPLGANGPVFVAADSAAGLLYVTMHGVNGAGSTVRVVDMTTNAVVAAIPAGPAPYGIALDSPRRRLYVTNYYGNTVTVIDTVLRSVVATVPVGTTPVAAAVTSDGRMVVVTNNGSHTISLIDTSTNTVTATVPVGTSPTSAGNGRFVTGEPLFVAAPTELSVAPATATYGGVLTLSATLTASAGQAVAGRTITFALGGVTAGSATTDASGVAILAGVGTGAFRVGVHVGAVVVGFAGESTYGASQARTDLLVGQASPGLTWATPAATRYGTLLGAAQLGATATVPGTFEYSPSAGTLLNAGTHALSVTFTPSDSNYANGVSAAVLIVTKAVPSISWPQAPHVYYNGHPHVISPRVTGVFGEVLGTTTVTYQRTAHEGEDQFPPGETAPTDAGDYVVVGSFGGLANYEPVTLTLGLRIEKATPVLALSSATFTYDGQPHPVLASVAGVLGEDLGIVTVGYTPGDVPPVDAGEYQVTGTFAGSSNYRSAAETATVTITRATPTMAVSGGDFVYDGRRHPVAVSLAGARGEAIDRITVDYTPGGVDAPIDAGSYTAAVAFPGNQNYEPINRLASIVVTRATPIVAVTGGTFGYDGRPHGAAATATGVLGEDLGGVAINYAPGDIKPSDAGTYTATATFAGSWNYAGASQSAVIVIQPGAPTILVSGGTHAYDGQPHPATGTVTGINGASLGTLTFTYNGLPTPPVNAGTYAVVGAFSGNANYDPASATTMVQITPVPIVVSATSATKTYGQPNPPFTLSIDGLVNGETAAVLAGVPSFATDVGATSGVGAYQVMPSGVTAQNYRVGFSPGVLTITQAGSQVVLSSSSNPAGYLQAIALRADVTPSPAGSGTATGTVEFLDAGTVIGSASVTVGAATINVILEPGTHEVTARYLGSSDMAAGGDTLSQVVNSRNESSTTSLRIKVAQSQVGDDVAFDIVVNAASGIPTGWVSLLDGSVELALLELSSGRVSYSTNQLGSGSHTFTARYLGNGSTTPSASAPVVHTVVDGVILERSSVRISVPARTQAGDAITVEVIVSGAGSAPAGQVALYLDNGRVGQLPLAPRAASSAAALFTLQPQTIGGHLLTAVYTGSGIHAGSTATIQLRVAR